MNKYLFAAILYCVINLIVILPLTSPREESGLIPRVNITYPPSNATTDPPLDYFVFGNSSDKSSKNCEVYLSINNGDPRLVTPHTDGNYSFWSYSSLDNSTLIVGQNNLTASYVCPNDPSSTANNSTVFTVDPNYILSIFAGAVGGGRGEGGGAVGGGATGGAAGNAGDLPSTGGGRLESPFK